MKRVAGERRGHFIPHFLGNTPAGLRIILSKNVGKEIRKAVKHVYALCLHGSHWAASAARRRHGAQLSDEDEEDILQDVY